MAHNHVTVVPENERDTDDENSTEDTELTPNYGVLR
jgi:hypothetical protein